MANLIPSSSRTLCPLRAPLCTCSSSSLSRCSWDSSCLLWSSRICMRVSRRLLCCRRIRASARSSSLRGSCTDSGELVAKVGDSTASSCCHFKRLSSPWRILQGSPGQSHHSPFWRVMLRLSSPGGFASSSTSLGWQAVGTQLLPRGPEQRQGKQSPPAVLSCGPPSTRGSERREAAVARPHLKQFKRGTWGSRGGTHSRVGQEPFEEQNLGEHQDLTEFSAPQRL